MDQPTAVLKADRSQAPKASQLARSAAGFDGLIAAARHVGSGNSSRLLFRDRSPIDRTQAADKLRKTRHYITRIKVKSIWKAVVSTIQMRDEVPTRSLANLKNPAGGVAAGAPVQTGLIRAACTNSGPDQDLRRALERHERRHQWNSQCLCSIAESWSRCSV
jgi:hypothetical protein